MRFTLTIDTGNTSINSLDQIADALVYTADRIYLEDMGKSIVPQDGFLIKDGAGNFVGAWDIRDI